MTLVETMVGIVVLTVGFVSMSVVFAMITRSFVATKNKSVAVNLAQEKIESLKNLSYYRLLITTSIAPADTNFPSASDMYFDDGTTLCYPEESLSVGGVIYKRRTFVEFLRQDGNDFVGYPTVTWWGNDTGIKRVTVYVVWQEENEWKKVELRNFRNNPDRAQMEYAFQGTISSGVTSNKVYNALVDTEQNPSYYD